MAGESSLHAANALQCDLGTCSFFPGPANYREKQAQINAELSKLQSSLGIPALIANFAVATLDNLVKSYRGVERYRAAWFAPFVRQTTLARDAADLALAESSARQSVEHSEWLARSGKKEANLAGAADCHLHLSMVLLDIGHPAEAQTHLHVAESIVYRLKQPTSTVLFNQGMRLTRQSASPRRPRSVRRWPAAEWPHFAVPGIAVIPMPLRYEIIRSHYVAIT